MKIEKSEILAVLAMAIMIGIIVLAYIGISFVTPSFTLTSSAFADNGMIPADYTCDGEGKNPPLAFANVPANTKSIVLLVQDMDTKGGNFEHWLLYEIDPSAKVIESGAVPTGSIEGLNSDKKTGYVPLCPPSGKTHRYLFTAYASDKNYHFVKTPSADALKKVMKWQVLGKAELTGKYMRVSQPETPQQ